MDKIRVVIDVNVFISYFFGNLTRERLDRVLFDDRLVLLVCDEFFAELREVLNRPKFILAITPNQINSLLQLLEMKSERIALHTNLKISRDQDDDYLLMMCLDGYAEFLITGDQDLLVLNPFGKIQILPLSVFCEMNVV